MAIIFRQLFDATSSTYTYIVADETTGEAAVIDSVFEQHLRDAALIRELGLKPLFALDTHVHADHVTGAWLLKEAFGTQIMLSESSGASGADRYLKGGETLAFGAHTLSVRSTPGHTNGCMTFVLDGGVMAFTGDALLIRSAGRTDFQQGDAAKLYASVRKEILSLPPQCLLYPAHDYSGRMVTTVAEEKKFNPRLGGDASEQDFVGFMSNLALPHPKQIDVAVPANLKCGKPEDGAPRPTTPTWAPLTRSYAGVLEVDPAWVSEHRADVMLLDVREAAEFSSRELGHATGATLIPLGTLRERLSELPKDKPVVVLCRSGRRSAQACAILDKAGFPQVANIPGGMIRWRSLGLP